MLEVMDGMSMHDISNILQSNNLLHSTFFLNQYSKISGQSTQIRSGEYLVAKDDSIISLLDKLSKGDIYYRSFRFKEGSTFLEILLMLDQREGVINNLGNNPMLFIKKATGSKYSFIEGIFAPDTYYFQKGDTASSLLIRAYKQQKEALDKLWKKKNKDLPYKTPEEVLTMASIIEKEGVEKKRIAGVFINRLNSNMRLQSDPTVIFALGKKFDGNIRKKDLRLRHPYNTYVIKGLPPGPISLVSLESIEAALRPEMSGYFYFVSRGDGTHQFSATLEQHNKAVKEYQIK